MASEKPTYRPQDAVGIAVKSTMTTGGAGIFISAIQNTLTRSNVNAWGVFTRTGGTIAVFAAMGGTYAFAKAASANLREKEDSWNSTIGGFLGGAVVGLHFRTIPAVLGYGAGAAILLGTFDYTGGSFRGFKKDPRVDEVERKEMLRKNRRRPLEETIAELGEGRGVYAPGYEERRRERLKARYGVDISSQS